MKELFWLTFGLVVGVLGGVWVMPKVQPLVPVAVVRQPPPAPIPAPVPQVMQPAPLPEPISQITVMSPAPVAKPAPDPWDQLSLLDLQAKCSKTEQNWLQKHFEAYAKKPSNETERKENIKELFEQLQESLEAGSWWRGEADVGNGDKTVHLAVMMKLYGARQTGSGDPLKYDGITTIASADDLCYAINGFFTLDGKTESQSASVCHDPGRKKDDSYYYAFNTANSRFANVVTAVLMPFPGKSGGKLEFLSGNSGQWASAADFAWSPSNFDEWQEMHDRYVQSFGQ